MKKILVLGAMAMHVPLINRAKERGLYVITCDYIPDNIGHSYANEPHYESTTDFEAVLSLAHKCQIDGILTFNSDPAALTAAYVSRKLGLPGSNYDSVKIMSEKDLFRKFLLEHNFNVPKFRTYSSVTELKKELDSFVFPVLLKPVDSSGSKGIAKINDSEHIEEIFAKAMSFSRCKRVIVEEYIEAKGCQLHGDGFVSDGVIQFMYLGDHHFAASINNLVPFSTTFPSQHSKHEIEMVKKEVQRFITEIRYTGGGINVEARISAKDGKVYLIEVGPRNGGNFTPIVIQHATGFNFVDAALDNALGIRFKKQAVDGHGYFAYLIVHSGQSGQLKSISLDQKLEELIIERHDYIFPGMKVCPFKGANSAIAVLLVHFSSLKEMNEIIENFSRYCKVNLSTGVTNQN